MSYSLTTLRRTFARRKLHSIRVGKTGVMANEVQTLTMSTAGGAATGGTFTLTYSGQTTGTIAFNASASDVQTALEALSNIAAGEVTVTGTGPWVVTFSGGSLDRTDVALMTSDAALVTGPGSPYTLAVAETQKGGYVGVVISSDADRQRKVLVSDWLSQSVVGGEESDLNTSEFDHGWLYLPSVPEQRPIATRGYTQSVLASEASDQAALTSTYTAAVTLRRPWTTLVTANQDIELHAKIPPLDDDERSLAGLHTLLNRALGVMGVPKRINIAAVSNQHAYSLAAYPWITRQDQLIRAVAYQPTSGFEQAPLGGTNTIRIDGNVAYFVTTGYPTAGQNFSLDVWMPRSAWIKVGGTWAASTAGLVNETDEAEVDINELSLVAYYFACDELAEHGTDGERGMWVRRRDEAAEQAAPFMRWQRERYDDPTDTPGWASDGWSSISGALSSSGSWP